MKSPRKNKFPVIVVKLKLNNDELTYNVDKNILTESLK
jgi:hypothetical protein